MIQRGEHLRFSLEARHALGIASHGFGQNFQGHVATELAVARAIHFAHAARTNRRDDLVRP